MRADEWDHTCRFTRCWLETSKTFIILSMHDDVQNMRVELHYAVLL